jgi:hypothetical protein
MSKVPVKYIKDFLPVLYDVWMMDRIGSPMDMYVHKMLPLILHIMCVE